jgi:hypothetical protein
MRVCFPSFRYPIVSQLCAPHKTAKTTFNDAKIHRLHRFYPDFAAAGSPEFKNGLFVGFARRLQTCDHRAMLFRPHIVFFVRSRRMLFSQCSYAKMGRYSPRKREVSRRLTGVGALLPEGERPSVHRLRAVT